ncbi:MAG: alanine--glyoxylate aminotransferase family protein [Candidatus Aenigmarchaeota archaeon]|nr:alanine--glyoxylate aminotransferase family protein [Candidatus Aenigmarchaeota archaeon]
MSEIKNHKKLFIPGPTEVRKEILEEMSHHMIGHRTEEFSSLFGQIKPKLQRLFYTQNDVLVSTSSGSGFMEAAIRNCVSKKVINCVCGAFSQKWYKIALSCGKQASKIEVEYGKAIKPQMVDEALKTGEYDAVCVTHCETSTGLFNPIEEISEIVKKYPDVLFLVDAVSSMGGTKIEVDKLGIDICLASVQKAMALPSGLSVASVSQKAYERAKTIDSRGYYFDLLELQKTYEKNQTPYTPSISHLYALRKQLDYIVDEEGLENRFKRHRQMADFVRNWAVENEMKMFSELGYESDTVSCISNTKGFDLKSIKQELLNKGYLADTGYRTLNEKLTQEGKPTTFRIAHMGDMQMTDIQDYLNEIETIFKRGK